MINPNTVTTGKGVVRATKGCAGLCFKEVLSQRTVSLDPMDWDLKPDPRYEDRVWAHRKDGAAPIDLSHVQLFNGSQLLWRMIDVPPHYTEVPAGEINNFPELSFPIGTKVALHHDATYIHGEVIPKGSVLKMAGYKTEFILRNGRRAIGFTPQARFPDGTYRQMPVEVLVLLN